MPSSGMLCPVVLVTIHVSEERIRVTRIGELGTTLAVTSIRRMLREILSGLLQEPHGVRSHKMALFLHLLCLKEAIII
jgi:hypothetical protein